VAGAVDVLECGQIDWDCFSAAILLFTNRTDVITKQIFIQHRLLTLKREENSKLLRSPIDCIQIMSPDNPTRPPS
jgi:hypothetical protein